jgi:Leucine-rich repeat (LRR) protein
MLFSFRALRDIPQQLFDNDLSPVNDLSLARNPLKSLPETITKFSNLKSLNLASTELSELPEMISALSRLTQISLAVHRFIRLTF